MWGGGLLADVDLVQAFARNNRNGNALR
jgi:hypothetical protein